MPRLSDSLSVLLPGDSRYTKVVFTLHQSTYTLERLQRLEAAQRILVPLSSCAVFPARNREWLVPSVTRSDMDDDGYHSNGRVPHFGLQPDAGEERLRRIGHMTNSTEKRSVV